MPAGMCPRTSRSATRKDLSGRALGPQIILAESQIVGPSESSSGGPTAGPGGLPSASQRPVRAARTRHQRRPGHVDGPLSPKRSLAHRPTRDFTLVRLSFSISPPPWPPRSPTGSGPPPPASISSVRFCSSVVAATAHSPAVGTHFWGPVRDWFPKSPAMFDSRSVRFPGCQLGAPPCCTRGPEQG